MLTNSIDDGPEAYPRHHQDLRAVRRQRRQLDRRRDELAGITDPTQRERAERDIEDLDAILSRQEALLRHQISALPRP